MALKWFLRRVIGNLGKKLIRFLESGSINLSGDRDVEWSFVTANISPASGQALDFGCGESYLGLIAAQAGYKVISLDLQPIKWPYCHPNLQFQQEDILDVDFPEGSFDLIINCSSIEHIGLAGRYGQRENYLDGDLEVMTKMRRLLKTTGRMLLTIPIGKDAVFPQLHRVYGKERIQKLLKDYTVEKKEFWIKNNKNKWVLSEESVALEKVPREDFYCLGCFILRPKSK